MSCQVNLTSAVAVLGAGPAGLTAGYRLTNLGVPTTVFEADDVVGGIARTVVRDGYRFDLGGHRFFTKSAEVERIWDELLGDEMLTRPRLSRILWNGRFLDYPLRCADVVAKVGHAELARCVGSYIAAAFRRRGQEDSFEEWVSLRFGRRLFNLFFKEYTEKVWGVSTTELRADWAAQRIKGLSLASAARATLLGNRAGIRTLINEFRYPRLGPGQMWEAMADEITRRGGTVALETPVERIETAGGLVRSVIAGGEAIEPSGVISSLPLRNVVGMLDPAPPAEVLAAARGLRYRDFLTVALALDGGSPFPDNWVYVHEPGVRVARIQNYGAWSPAMVPHEGTSCLGLEFFCFAGDELWRMDDADLVELATSEVQRLGLVPAAAVLRGWVARVPKAYPMYDRDYDHRVTIIRNWLAGFSNLQQIGRNGLHRYNNSDHSMLTALRAVENLVQGTDHDVWSVNADGVYHEEIREPAKAANPYIDAPATPAMEESLVG
jgi:protoporphyrinogen oxidase